MKAVMRLSLLLFISTAMLTSCKKSTPKQTKFIPKGAMFVASINSKSLQGKLVESQVTFENIVKNFSNDSSLAKGRKEWEDLKNSGVDLEENLFLSMVKKGGGMQSSAVVSAIGGLKDAGKFEAYLKKKKPTDQIRKEKDYSYIKPDGTNMIAWGKDVIIFMMNQQSYSGGMEYDSITGQYNLKKPGAGGDTEMKAEMASYFNLKEDESIASIPEFRDLMQDKSDASFWANSSASIEDIPLPKLKELVKNSFTAATIDFEDGKVVTNTKSYSSPDLKDILKKYAGPTVDLGLVESYPTNNMNGFMVFSFNPEIFNAIVQYMEVGGVVDGYLTKAFGSTFTLKDALKALKGDIAVMMSDFSYPVASPNGNPTAVKPLMGFLFNATVGDKVQMYKLMDKLVEFQLLVKENGMYRTGEVSSNLGLNMSVDDKNLIVYSDPAKFAQYQAKTVKATIDKDVMDNLKGKSTALYFNIASILNGVPTNVSPIADSILPKAKATFKDIRGYGENFNGKYTEGHFELRLQNEKENSLTSLANFFAVAAKQAKSYSDFNGSSVQIDTVYPGGMSPGFQGQVDTATMPALK